MKNPFNPQFPISPKLFYDDYNYIYNCIWNSCSYKNTHTKNGDKK